MQVLILFLTHWDIGLGSLVLDTCHVTHTHVPLLLLLRTLLAFLRFCFMLGIFAFLYIPMQELILYLLTSPYRAHYFEYK